MSDISNPKRDLATIYNIDLAQPLFPGASASGSSLLFGLTQPTDETEILAVDCFEEASGVPQVGAEPEDMVSLAGNSIFSPDSVLLPVSTPARTAESLRASGEMVSPPPLTPTAPTPPPTPSHPPLSLPPP